MIWREEIHILRESIWSKILVKTISKNQEHLFKLNCPIFIIWKSFIIRPKSLLFFWHSLSLTFKMVIHYFFLSENFFSFIFSTMFNCESILDRTLYTRWLVFISQNFELNTMVVEERGQDESKEKQESTTYAQNVFLSTARVHYLLIGFKK